MRSCQSHCNDLKCFILLVNGQEHIRALQHSFPELFFLSLSDLPQESIEFLTKKYPASSNSLRWSLKPVLLKALLANCGITEALYCDNDIFFFQAYDFLFHQLKDYNILLFPHWRISHPQIDKDWFETNFKDGIFNGGCIGVNSKAVDFLNWWADCCAYRCEIDFSSGLYVDQKYLDAVPVLFPDSKIIRHKGCNVAYWNIHSLTRTTLNGKTLIDEHDEIVFIHFTGDYLRVLAAGEDRAVQPYYHLYMDTMQQSMQLVSAVFKNETNIA